MKMKNITKSMLGLLGLMMLLSIHVKAQLLWADEFNGTSVNTANWNYDIGAGGWGNAELEYYRSQNATVSGGYLNITARRESYGGAAYTSARMKTQGKKSWTYGWMESRIKMPKGKGLWPAFWMIGNNIGSVGWPKCGELDIMEHVNSEGAIVGSMHWDSNGHQLYNGTKAVDVGGWHNYQLNWNSTSLRWYVDGSLYLTGNIANNINGTEEFKLPFFFILNLAVGGVWPGSPDGSTVFPAVMQVDYVRVYQQSNARAASEEEVVNAESEVRLLSNPVRETVRYTVPEGMENHTLKIYDVQGKIVATHDVRNAKGENSIDVSSAKSGYYILDLYNDRLRKKIRILKD
jgi:beta-glucanase (GH16 family)